MLSKSLLNISGIKNVTVMMGTDVNKDIMKNSNLFIDGLKNARNNDMCCVIDSDEDLKEVVKKEIELFFKKKNNDSKKEKIDIIYNLNSIDYKFPNVNVALVSIPGKYVYKEAIKLLKKFKLLGSYCGGTLAYESLLFLEKNGYEVYSNLSKHSDKKLGVKDLSKKHSIIDMGDDEFTVGKPHPMIDPSLRSERLLEESQDKDLAVLLIDDELGYVSNNNAAKILYDDIKKLKKKEKL